MSTDLEQKIQELTRQMEHEKSELHRKQEEYKNKEHEITRKKEEYERKHGELDGIKKELENKKKHQGCLGCFGLIIIFFVIVFIASNNKTEKSKS